jgi:F-type H+-transporting ATPase subunit epsilon
MTVRILTPSKIVLEQKAGKVTAEGMEGSFAMLPGHIDYAAALVPGIVEVTDQDQRRSYFAVDEGVLVKQGDDVTISTPYAFGDDDLGNLEAHVREEFSKIDEKERETRKVLTRLETDFVRRLMEIE